MTTQQSIAVETDISQRDFVRKYIATGTPVLLKGVLKHLPAGQWTPESLKAKHADKMFEVDGTQVRFGDFVDGVLASTADKPAPYMRNVSVNANFPELIADLQPGLPQTRSNWRFQSFLPQWYFESACQFFFTGPGRGFPFMHVDYPPMDTFSALSYGKKEWLLYAPDQAKYLYEADGGPGWPVVSKVANPFDPDFEKYPDFAKASGMRVMQEAGDVIFVPNGWWHTARSHAVTITVAWDHLSAASWKPFSKYMLSSPAYERRSALRMLVMKSFLSLAATGLTIRDALTLPFSGNVQSGRIV